MMYIDVTGWSGEEINTIKMTLSYVVMAMMTPHNLEKYMKFY